MLLGGCEPSALDNAPKSDQRNEIEVIDFAGNRVVLDKPAERIVALAPHIVENLFEIGAGEHVVGVVTHSDYPPAAQNLPIVGGYEQTNYERIVELNPDLVVAWESGNSQANISKLRELGFTIFIDQPDSLNDIATSLEKLGVLTGQRDKASIAAKAFLKSLSAHRKRYADARRVDVFYQVWDEPLYTINGNHIISDAIRACGGRNVFAHLAAIAPRVNIESVIAAEPEAIIASGMGEARPEWLNNWENWPALPAVANGNLFFVNPDHLQRHTVRQLLAIDAICAQLEQARNKPQ